MAIKKLSGFDPDIHLQYDEEILWQSEKAEAETPQDKLQSGQLAWKFKTGGSITGGIIFVIDKNGNRRIYFGTTERELIAVETDSQGFDARMVWKESLAGEIISTPLFKDSVIYTATKNGGIFAIDSGLYDKKYTPDKALNETPEIIWEGRLSKGINTQPFLSSNLLLVSSWDDHLHAFEAFYNNPDSYQIGKEKWSFRAEGINSSPNLFEGTVYMGDDEGNLFAINYGGKSPEKFWSSPVGSPIWTRPYVDELNIFISTIDGQVMGVDAGQGKVLWKFKTGDKIYSDPVAFPVEGGRKGVIVGSDDGHIYALVPTTSGVSPLWKIRTKGRVRARPLLSHGKVFIGSGDNNFYCVEAASGTILWRYSTDGNVYSNAAIMGDKVLFGSTDGFLYCVKI